MDFFKKLKSLNIFNKHDFLNEERELNEFIDKFILENWVNLLPYTTYSKKKDLIFSSKKLINLEDSFISLINVINSKLNSPAIWYDKTEEVLTISEELPEKYIKELLYTAGAQRKWSIRPTLAEVFSYSHIRKRGKEILLKALKFNSWDAFSETLGGKCIFSGKNWQRFWVKWKSTYTISDTKKADWFLLFPFLLQNKLEIIIRDEISNYVLEVGEGISSFVYNPEILKNQGSSQPVCPDLPSLLGDVVLKKAALYFNEKFGIKIAYFIAEDYSQLDLPCLGLLEFTSNERKRISEREKEIILMELKEVEESKRNSNQPPLSWQQQILKWREVGINFYDDKDIEIAPESFKKFVENVEIGRNKLSESDRWHVFLLLKYFLEFFVQEKDFHWLYGFIIFPSWRKKKISNYLGTLSKYISFLNRLGRKANLWTIEATKSQRGNRFTKGYWALEGISSIFSSNILEAKEICESIDRYEKLDKKINLSKKAIRLYPDYLKAHLLLVEYWENSKFKNVNPEEIKEIQKFFVEKENVYRKAITTIFRLKKRRKELYWSHKDTQEVIDRIQEQFQRIEHFVRILKNWRKEQKILSLEEEECERVLDLMEKIRDENTADESYSLLLRESLIMEVVGRVMRFLCPQIEVLPGQKGDLSEALKVSDELRKESRTSKESEIINEAVSDIYTTFFDLIIQKRLDITDLKVGDPEGFKNKLTEILVKEIKKQKMKEHPMKEVPLREDYSEEYQKYPQKDSF